MGEMRCQPGHYGRLGWSTSDRLHVALVGGSVAAPPRRGRRVRDRSEALTRAPGRGATPLCMHARDHMLVVADPNHDVLVVHPLDTVIILPRVPGHGGQRRPPGRWWAMTTHLSGHTNNAASVATDRELVAVRADDAANPWASTRRPDERPGPATAGAPLDEYPQGRRRVAQYGEGPTARTGSGSARSGNTQSAGTDADGVQAARQGDPGQRRPAPQLTRRTRHDGELHRALQCINRHAEDDELIKAEREPRSQDRQTPIAMAPNAPGRYECDVCSMVHLWVPVRSLAPELILVSPDAGPGSHAAERASDGPNAPGRKPLICAEDGLSGAAVWTNRYPTQVSQRVGRGPVPHLCCRYVPGPAQDRHVVWSPRA